MIPARTLRSRNVLRTLQSIGKPLLAPHAAYMKVTCLELEKLRLNKAREHALRRIGDIDSRLRELHEQKAALLKGMEDARTGPPLAGTQSGGGAPRGLRVTGPGKARFSY